MAIFGKAAAEARLFGPHTIPDGLTPAECAAVLALADAAGFAPGGLVRGVEDDGIRRAGLAWLDDAGEASWVLARIAALVAEANRTAFRLDLDGFEERMQVARYSAEAAGHFAWHADIGDGPLAWRRKLTLVIQLSDPASYAGGALETNADAQVRAARRDLGAVTVFPSFVLHRVTPVTAGVRHSLTTWVHGPAFR